MEDVATATSSISKYEPKFGRVLIKREIIEKTKGGIILPDNQVKRHAPCIGVIVALGETAGYTDTYYKAEDGSLQTHTIQTLEVGKKILFGRHAGTWLDGGDDDGTLYMCQDQDILAVIKE